MKKYVCLLSCMLVSFFSGYAQKITFTPQWTPQSQFAGYYVALEKGFYTEVGLDVSFVHPTNSYNSMNMLTDGTSDIITAELIHAMMTVDKGTKLINLLQTTQHSTLVLLAHNRGITQMSDLAGARIGTWKMGFSEIPQMINQGENLGFEWVQSMLPLNIYISGAVDAALAKSYNELLLFYMAGVTPGSLLKFSEMGYDFPEDGLYVSEKFFNQHPEACRKFAQASRRGWEWARAHRAEALDIVMKYVKSEKVPTNVHIQKWMLEAVLEAQEDFTGGAPSFTLNIDAFNRLNDELLKYGFISKPIIYNTFIGGDAQ
ncbi:MAG: ABC transporter substrate-binding protein [Bacteroidaceae bacterium]|nr:ABC transporter substrate-binding protein [Bacteroidaceae bacterium]